VNHEPCALIGRTELISDVIRAVEAGTSVLLVGPSGVGKTAVVQTVCSGAAATIVDPFEHISRIHAARLRRRLDRNGVIVGAARDLDRGTLGAVGRILWRFDIRRVRPLSAVDIRALLRRELTERQPEMSIPKEWLRELGHRTKGLPGRAIALASATAAYWDRRHALPTPEWTITEALVAGFRDRKDGHTG
jgi:hypothetical protein